MSVHKQGAPSFLPRKKCQITWVKFPSRRSLASSFPFLVVVSPASDYFAYRQAPRSMPDSTATPPCTGCSSPDRRLGSGNCVVPLCRHHVNAPVALDGRGRHRPVGFIGEFSNYTSSNRDVLVRFFYISSLLSEDSNLRPVGSARGGLARRSGKGGRCAGRAPTSCGNGPDGSRTRALCAAVRRVSTR